MRQLTKPMISHRGEEFRELLKDCVERVRELMFTENPVFISTSSSTGLMEAAIRNCVAERCLCLANGAFGERWHKIALANGKEAKLLDFGWGYPYDQEKVKEELESNSYDAVTMIHNESSTGVTNPVAEVARLVRDCCNDDTCVLVDVVSSIGGIEVYVDKWGLDVCLFGTQKALALPPGLSVCSVSERALRKAKGVRDRGHYFDFLLFYECLQRGQTPTTAAIPQMRALSYKLRVILEEEGLGARWERHRKLGEVTRGWAKRNFALFPKDERTASNTITCVENTRNIDCKQLARELAKKGYEFANGYGKLAGKTFRIAHMGDLSLEELELYLEAIEDVLSSFGG